MAAAPKNKQRLKVNVYGMTEVFPSNREDWKPEDIPSMSLLDLKKKIVARYIKMSDKNDQINLNENDIVFKIHGKRIDNNEKENSVTFGEKPQFIGDILFMTVEKRDDLVLPSKLEEVITNSENLANIGKFMAKTEKKENECQDWTLKFDHFNKNDDNKDDNNNASKLDISDIKQLNVKNTDLVGALREMVFNKLVNNEENKKSGVLNGQTKNNIRLHFNYADWVLRCDDMEIQNMAKIRNGDTILVSIVSEKENGQKENDINDINAMNEEEIVMDMDNLQVDGAAAAAVIPQMIGTPAPSAVDPE